MARRFIVRPLAEADLDDAARWYDEEHRGLSRRFLSDVDDTFARIRELPLQFPAVAHDVRRALLHTFPYAVYFRMSDETVAVLAIVHLRRNPKIWQARVRS
jgi:plasmid stabilization system protein ParE